MSKLLRLNRDDRALVGAIVIAIEERLRLDIWPTPFAFEGTGIAAVRAKKCLAGMRWKIADELARMIVCDALRRTGAVRPTWEDGQPVVRIGVDMTREGGPHGFGRCESCGVELHADRGAKRRFCSERCKRRSLHARGPLWTCQHCGKPFHRLAPPVPLYCGHSCLFTAYWARRRAERAAA